MTAVFKDGRWQRVVVDLTVKTERIRDLVVPVCKSSQRIIARRKKWKIYMGG